MLVYVCMRNHMYAHVCVCMLMCICIRMCICICICIAHAYEYVGVYVYDYTSEYDGECANVYADADVGAYVVYIICMR